MTVLPLQLHASDLRRRALGRKALAQKRRAGAAPASTSWGFSNKGAVARQSIAPNQGIFSGSGLNKSKALMRCRGYLWNPQNRVWLLFIGRLGPRKFQMFGKTPFLPMLAGAAGGAVAIAVMEAFSIRRDIPLWAIPFATSIVTVLGSPEAKPAQPRALLGGHIVSTIVGLVMVKIFGPNPWAAAAAVGFSMIAMHLSDTFHPPAGIDPLVVVTNDMSWSFLLVPVGIGAVLLALFAFAWHRLVAFGPNRPDKWPVRWW